MALAPEEIKDFYDACYEPTAEGEKYRRWRELGAVGKADHVVELAQAVGCGSPGVVAEVGCGDGAVLDELGRRGFGQRRIGLEISSSGVRLAAERPEIHEALLFDGNKLPVGDDAWDLAFATHVFEHVPDPLPLLREMLRAAPVVIIEVPLEDNLSARRPAARAASQAVGHLHRFSRADIRRLVAEAGGTVRGELLDPLPLAVHLFDRNTPVARANGFAKWAIRRTLAAVPPLGERMFTMHYAVAAVRAGTQA
jgi:SAM-dependent methyltransferase